MSANVFRKLEISPWKSAQTQRKGGIKTMMFVRWGFILYNSVLAVSDFPKHSSILQHSQCRTFKALRRTEYQVYLNRYCVLGLCSEYCSLRLQRIPQDFQYKPWNCDVANTRTCGIPNLWGGGACSKPWYVRPVEYMLCCIYFGFLTARGGLRNSADVQKWGADFASCRVTVAVVRASCGESTRSIDRHPPTRRSQADQQPSRPGIPEFVSARRICSV